MSLSVTPHVQIELYSSFEIENEKAKLGYFTDVVAIAFNPYLDYYRLTHWQRVSPSSAAVEVAAQNIYYHALCAYLENNFGHVPKDNFIFRYLDIPLSPLICWLEHWSNSLHGMPTSKLEGKSAKETVGFADELQSIIAPIGSMTVTEPPSNLFPIPFLANSECLLESIPDSIRDEINKKIEISNRV